MSKMPEITTNSTSDRGSFFRLRVQCLRLRSFISSSASTLAHPPTSRQNDFYFREVCGVTQLFYVIPLYLSARKQVKWKEANGVVVAAAIVFILNAGCWGIL